MSAGGMPPMNIGAGVNTRDMSPMEAAMAMRNRLRGYYPGRGFGASAGAFQQDAMARGIGLPSEYLRAAGFRGGNGGNLFGVDPGSRRTMGMLPGYGYYGSGGRRPLYDPYTGRRLYGSGGRKSGGKKKSGSSSSSSASLPDADKATKLLGEVGSKTRNEVQTAANLELSRSILKKVQDDIAAGRIPSTMLDEIGVQRDSKGNITGFDGLSKDAAAYLLGAEQKIAGAVIDGSRYVKGPNKGQIYEKQLGPTYARNEASKIAGKAAPPTYVAVTGEKKPALGGVFGGKPTDTYAMDVLVPQQKPASINNRSLPDQPAVGATPAPDQSPIVNAVSGAQAPSQANEKTWLNLPGRVKDGVVDAVSGAANTVGNAVGGAAGAVGDAVAGVPGVMAQNVDSAAGAALDAINNRTAELEAHPEKRYQGVMGLFAPSDPVAAAPALSSDMTPEEVKASAIQKLIEAGHPPAEAETIAEAMLAKRYSSTGS
jgi:hypothetical protein